MGKTVGKCDALEVEVAAEKVELDGGMRLCGETGFLFQLLCLIHVLVTASGRVVTPKKKFLGSLCPLGALSGADQTEFLFFLCSRFTGSHSLC